MTDHVVPSRSPRRSGAARLWRGWTVAVLAVLLAAGGHQAAHSISHGVTDVIPWELLGFAIALTAPIAVALAGLRIAVWSTGLTTVIGQLAFHTLYSLPQPSAAHQSGMHHESAALAADGLMLSAHLLAATLITWVVVYGERSLVTIVAWLLLAPVKLVLAALPDITARPKPVLPIGRVWIPHPMNIAQTRWTRGPPVLA